MLHIVGCAAPYPATVETEETPTVLRFACDGRRRTEFESWAAEFHAQNPDVLVQFVPIEDILDMTGAGGPAATYHKLAAAADTNCVPLSSEAIDLGLVRDLTPFIAGDRSFASDDFFPGTLDAFRLGETVWGLPADVWIHILYYRSDMFDRARIAYPGMEWTPDDFLAVAQRLTERTEEKTTQFGFVDGSSNARQAWITALLEAAGSPETPLDAPLFEQGLRWYTDLAERYQIMPVPAVGSSASDYENLITRDGVAMWFESLMSDLDQYAVGPLGMALFPTPTGTRAPALIRGYWMSSGTASPDESWRWLRFLSHKRVAEGGIRTIFLPARRSVAASTGYWDQFNDETRGFVESVAEHHLSIVGLDPRFQRLNAAIDAVFEGTPVEEALAEAQIAWEDYQAQLTQATPAPVVVDVPAASATDIPSVAFAPPGGADTTVYRNLASDFNQTHLDMQVQIVDPAQAQQADCFADLRSITDSASRADLLNLQPLLDADPAFSSADFSPRLLDSLRDRGDLWGLPFQAQARVMFYNRDLFDEAGVAYPQPGWTLDDFLAAAVALTQGAGDQKQYGFLPLNGDASDLTTFLALQGAYPWDERGQPRFDAPEVVAAVRWYTDLAMTHGVTPAFPNDLPDRDPQAQTTRNALVHAGKVAMWSDFSGVERRDVWPSAAAIGMAPLPVGQAAVTQFLPQGLFLAADTSHAAACWQWIGFLSQQPAAMQGMPARFSALESPAFAAQVTSDVLSTYRALADYDDLPVTPSPEATAQLAYLHQAVADILDGARPEVALARAQEQATR